MQQSEAGKVYIVPTLQMNLIKYREDEHTFLNMIKTLISSNQNARLKIATGYLNLQKEFVKELSKCDKQPGQVQILTSSPSANGFYRAGMVKKFIPGLYRVNEEKLLKQAPHVQMFEYENSGWTFHGKGAWIYEDLKDKQDEKVTMSVIGSSNFSYRSNRRDTECQLYILPECEDLQKRLDAESKFLFSQAKQVDLKTVQNDGTDKITWKERLLNRLFHTYI